MHFGRCGVSSVCFWRGTRAFTLPSAHDRHCLHMVGSLAARRAVSSSPQEVLKARAMEAFAPEALRSRWASNCEVEQAPWPSQFVGARRCCHIVMGRFWIRRGEDAPQVLAQCPTLTLRRAGSWRVALGRLRRYSKHTPRSILGAIFVRWNLANFCPMLASFRQICTKFSGRREIIGRRAKTTLNASRYRALSPRSGQGARPTQRSMRARGSRLALRSDPS